MLYRHYIALVAVLFTGCGSLSEKLIRLDRANIESAQVYTTGVVDALGRVEVEHRTPAVLVANELARYAQSIEGLPTPSQRLNVAALIEKNSIEVRKLEDRLSSDGRHAIELRDTQDRLIQLGMVKEQEDKRSLLKRISAWIIGTVGLGGFIALLVFFPFLIPILLKVVAMLIGWIIGKIPAAIGFFGMVAKGTVENIVKGVGSVREELKSVPPEKLYTSKEVLALLDDELKIATDVQDKKVINNIRDKVNT